MTTLTLAHSADADDVFMWWPITGRVDPRDPSLVLAPPVLDTGRFSFRSLPEDIQVLNSRAIERGDLDITALSFAALVHAVEPDGTPRYRPTTCGSSFGRGWGPKLVARADRPDLTLAYLGAEREGGRRDACPTGNPKVTIAVPGRQTSAFLVLSCLLPPDSFTVVERPFDRIIDAVASGETDLGLLIHESQLTFQHAGLRALADLGVWFNQTHGLPMPLGTNAVRADLDQRLGPGTLKEVTRLLHASIRYALAHPGRVAGVCPELFAAEERC